MKERSSLAIPEPTQPEYLPPLRTVDFEVGFRIHREARPKNPKRYRAGKFRFDAPAGEYKVTYVNVNRYACFAEVFGNSGEIPRDAGERFLSQMTTHRPLRLLDLDDATVWARFGLDGNINTDTHYELTQPWSRAWHDWYPDMDGVQYPGRRAGRHLNCCLFLDRCSAAVSFRCVGMLKELSHIVARAAERYALPNRLFP